MMGSCSRNQCTLLHYRVLQNITISFSLPYQRIETSIFFYKDLKTNIDLIIVNDKYL